MNHSTTDSLCCVSFGVRTYHSTPTEWNDIVLTDESGFCRQHHDGQIRVWSHRDDMPLNSCIIHRHTGPSPYHGLHLPSAIFQQDNARPHGARNVQEFFFTHQIKLLPWPACSLDLSPIENVWSLLAQRLARDTPPTATPDQLRQYVEATWTVVPQEYIQGL
ncbi:transposable element Tcb1 transposase [Trichonephila clavipes]|nr:transposable element Tcb1 transposase [Trichonephila clavipes]